MDTLTPAITPEATAGSLPNPWRTMWLSPRATIRRILDAEERPNWIPVVALAVASNAIAAIQLDDTGAVSAAKSAMPVVLSGLYLVGGVIVGPFIAAFVGNWLGGEADPADLRHVFAWSYVPIAVSAAFWIPMLLTLGTRAFTNDSLPLTGLEWIGASFAICMGICALWSIPLQVGGLAAAQRFSLGKAILYLMILWIPVFILLAIQ